MLGAPFQIKRRSTCGNFGRGLARVARRTGEDRARFRARPRPRRLSRAAHQRARLRHPAAHDRRPAGQRPGRARRSGPSSRRRSAMPRIPPAARRQRRGASRRRPLAPEDRLCAQPRRAGRLGPARSRHPARGRRGGDRRARPGQGHRPLVGGNLSAVRRRPARHLAGRRPRGPDRDRPHPRPRRQARARSALRELAEAWRPHRGAAAIFAWHHYRTPVL